MKYLFQDIEEMRRMTADLLCCEGGYLSSENISPITVEDRLRTYLAYGVAVDDMRPAYQEAIERYEARVGKLSRL